MVPGIQQGLLPFPGDAGFPLVIGWTGRGPGQCVADSLRYGAELEAGRNSFTAISREEVSVARVAGGNPERQVAPGTHFLLTQELLIDPGEGRLNRSAGLACGEELR